MVRKTTEDIQYLLKCYKIQGTKYRMFVSGQSIRLVVGIGKFVIKNKEADFPPSELNFIKQIKRHIIEQKLYKKIPKRYVDENTWGNIKYFHYRKSIPLWDEEIIEDAYEMDLKSAYFETAYKMGLIPEHLYKKANEVHPFTKKPLISKKTRLASIGTCAKRETEFYFDGKKTTLVTIHRNEETECVWYAICDKVGKIMKKAERASGKDFLFFWVDALFCRSKDKDAINIFKDLGYKNSVKKLHYVHRENEGIIVTDYLKKDKKIGRYDFLFKCDYINGVYSYIFTIYDTILWSVPLGGPVNYQSAIGTAKIEFEKYKQDNPKRKSKLINLCRPFPFKKEDGMIWESSE